MNQSLQVTYELVQTKVQDKAAAQTEKSMKKLASKATIANASIAAATGAAVGAIAALGGAMFLTVGAASKFEDSFAGIRKTVDASEGDFNRLGAQIRQLAQDIPVAVTQLNAIGELGGQLGVDVENLEEFIEVIAQIGVATRLSTESAALSLARMDQIFNLGGKSFDRLASSLVDLGNNFAALEDEILSTALRLAAAGKVAGATAADVFGIATALQAVGVQSQAGGTAMARVFQQIQIAVSSGGKQLEVFSKTTGLTTEQFQSLAKSDPAGALNLFVTSLAAASKAGTNIIEVLDQLGLKQQRTIRALLAVGEAEGLLTDALATANTAFEANIALTTEAEKRFETFKSQTKLLGNELTELRIQIGNELMPIAKTLVVALSSVIGGFQNADEEAGKLAPALKFLFGVIVAGTSSMVLLGQATRVFTAASNAMGMTEDKVRLKIARGTLQKTAMGKAAIFSSKAITAMRFSLIGLSSVLAVVTVAMAIFTRKQEKARQASENFLKNRAASAGITQLVLDKEKELQDLLTQEDIPEQRIEMMEAELEKMKEIEEQINKKSIQDFFKQAGFDKAEAEEAQESLDDVSNAISNFFNSGLGEEINITTGQINTSNIFTDAIADAATLDAHLQGLGMSFEDLDTLAPNELLDVLGMLESKGINALELYARIIDPILRTNNLLNAGTVELTAAQEEQFSSLRGQNTALRQIQKAFRDTDLSEKALTETIQNNIDAFNELESRQGMVAVTLDDVLDGSVAYVNILKAIDGEQENAAETATQLAEAAFALSDQVAENVREFRSLNQALESFGRVAPTSLNLIAEGLEIAGERADFVQLQIVDLAERGFVPLAVAISDMPFEQAFGLALSLGSATKDEITAIQEAVIATNAELRTLSFNEEQIDDFIAGQEMMINAQGLNEQTQLRIRVQAEAQLQLELEQAEAALKIFNIASSEEQTRERILELQQDMADMTAEISANGITITQEQIRQLDVIEAQEGFLSAINEFGHEGVVTASEELAILQSQLNLQRMRDKIEGKMSNRDKIRIRDKEKEVKFLELAVEQGVAEQLDLDAAKDELAGLKQPISDAEMEILKLQEQIAEAQLEVLERQAERLDPAVVDAIKNVAAAQSLEADAVEKYAEKENDLAEAMLGARIESEKNALVISELTKKYPGLKGIVSEIAKDVGIPETILNKVLNSMDQSMSAYEKKIDDAVEKGQKALFDFNEILTFIETHQKQLGIDLANTDFSRFGAKETGPNLTESGRTRAIVERFGDPDEYFGRMYGGVIPAGRTSTVGEVAAEKVMALPNGGAMVFAGPNAGRANGITVANMNVHITGLPADPLSARKAAINIRKELMKLEAEGTAGTGLRNR